MVAVPVNSMSLLIPVYKSTPWELKSSYSSSIPLVSPSISTAMVSAIIADFHSCRYKNPAPANNGNHQNSWQIIPTKPRNISRDLDQKFSTDYKY